MSTVSFIRAAGLLAALVLAASFFIPVAETFQGYQAFLLSFESWGTTETWEPEALPIVLSWLANVGALFGLASIFLPKDRSRWVRMLSLMGVLTLGPLLAAPDDLLLGYYLWMASIMAIMVLALVYPRVEPPLKTAPA